MLPTNKMAVAPSFLVPPTVPPPIGLQEVVEIQNKIPTKSEQASPKLRPAPPGTAGSAAELPALGFRQRLGLGLVLFFFFFNYYCF